MPATDRVGVYDRSIDVEDFMLSFRAAEESSLLSRCHFLNYWGGKMAEIQLRISVALFVPSAHFGPAPRREIRDQGMIMPVTNEARRMRPMPG
jgi:hypothetical protein